MKFTIKLNADQCKTLQDMERFNNPDNPRPLKLIVEDTILNLVYIAEHNSSVEKFRKIAKKTFDSLTDKEKDVFNIHFKND